MEKNCKVDLKANQLKQLKMLMVDLIIILFYLKLDRFHCIGARNQLKMNFYDLFFVQIKISCYFSTRQELLPKAKDRYHNCGGKEKAAQCYIANK